MEICLVVIQYLLVRPDSQNLSERFLKQLTVSVETAWFERLFHMCITRFVKLNFLSHSENDETFNLESVQLSQRYYRHGPRRQFSAPRCIISSDTPTVHSRPTHVSFTGLADEPAADSAECLWGLYGLYRFAAQCCGGTEQYIVTYVVR